MTANVVIATLLIAGSALAPVISAFDRGVALRSQPQTQKPIRVFVETDDNGVAEELAARKTSVKDLAESLASRKKLFVVVDDEDKSEIQIDVLGRGLTVPKVVLGIGPRPGESSIGSAPTKNAELRIRVTVASSDLTAELKNKNKANDNPRGWKSAADDLVDQLDKWVFENRAAIGRAGSFN